MLTDSQDMRNEKGQTVIEYVLVAVLISLALIIAFWTANLNEAVGNAADNAQEHFVAE